MTVTSESIKQAVENNMKLRIAMQDFWIYLQAAVGEITDDPERQNCWMRCAVDCYTKTERQ